MWKKNRAAKESFTLHLAASLVTKHVPRCNQIAFKQAARESISLGSRKSWSCLRAATPLALGKRSEDTFVERQRRIFKGCAPLLLAALLPQRPLPRLSLGLSQGILSVSEPACKRLGLGHRGHR